MGKKPGRGLAPFSDRKIPRGVSGAPKALLHATTKSWQGLHEGPWPAQAGPLQVQ